MEPWLSLTVFDPPPVGNNPKVSRVHIHVPKRTVRLAVVRNRIKRVLREAVKTDLFFKRPGVFRIRVSRMPGTIGLKEAQKALGDLHD